MVFLNNLKFKSMCFILFSKTEIKPAVQTAKEDINVFKVLLNNGRSPYYDLHINKYYEPWKKGYEYYQTTPFRGESWNKRRQTLEVTTNCFHSNITIEDAKDFKRGTLFIFDSLKIVKMIIPKGAKYYKNGSHYTSSRIIYPH